MESKTEATMWKIIMKMDHKQTGVKSDPKFQGGRRQKNIGGAITKYKIGARWRFTA